MGNLQIITQSVCVSQSQAGILTNRKITEQKVRIRESSHFGRLVVLILFLTESIKGRTGFSKCERAVFVYFTANLLVSMASSSDMSVRRACRDFCSRLISFLGHAELERVEKMRGLLWYNHIICWIIGCTYVLHSHTKRKV